MRIMSDDDDFEPVFLLAGQSNMAGRCDGRDLPFGSTNLHCNWNPNNTNDDHPKPNQKAYFRRFIQFCQSALAEDTKNDGAALAGPPRKKKLVGMFWLQGEGDSTKTKDANSYLSNLQSFVDAVRHELDVRTSIGITTSLGYGRSR